MTKDEKSKLLELIGSGKTAVAVKYLEKIDFSMYPKSDWRFRVSISIWNFKGNYQTESFH